MIRIIVNILINIVIICLAIFAAKDEFDGHPILVGISVYAISTIAQIFINCVVFG